MDKKILEPFVRSEVLSPESSLRGYVIDSKGNSLFNRPLFYRLEKYVRDFLVGMDKNRWIIMPGLRGTGKTTILAQIYFNLINDKKISASNILFLPMDRISKLMKSDLYEVITLYEEMVGKKLEESPEKLFLLIDEAHYDSKWDIACKAIFDRTKNVFILVTGSSALALHSADSARRVQKEHLFPLSFIEYIMLKFRRTPVKSLKERIESILLNSKDADVAFKSLKKIEPEAKTYWNKIDSREINKYITTGTLGFTLDLSEEEVYKRILTILDKVVYEDLTKIKEFDRPTLSKIWNLLFYLSSSLDSVNLDSLSSKIGMAKPTLVSVLSILEKSEIIYSIKAYGSPMKQVRKTPKYTFVAPAIKASLLAETGQLNYSTQIYGKLFEDVVASYLYRIKETKGLLDIKYDSEEGGTDFIIMNKTDNKNIPLEVGYGEKSDKQVLQTMKKVNSKYGILISETNLEVKNNVLYLPKELFLLL